MNLNIENIGNEICNNIFEYYGQDLLKILKICKEYNYTEDNKFIYNDLDNSVYWSLVENGNEAIILGNELLGIEMPSFLLHRKEQPLVSIGLNSGSPYLIFLLFSMSCGLF